MSFASFVTKLGDALSDGVKTVAGSQKLRNAVKYTSRTGAKVGKAVLNTGFTAGVKGATKGLDAATYVMEHGDEIKEGAARIGKAFAREGSEWAHAGVGAIGKIVDTFTTPTTLDKSLIGRKINKKGLAAVALIATGMEGTKDMKQYIDSRQGQNDGRIYNSTPTMSTPYQLSQQMAYSSHGNSYADNAGATGDLVFALNNSRRG